jgi:hypothetical protein
MRASIFTVTALVIGAAIGTSVIATAQAREGDVAVLSRDGAAAASARDAMATSSNQGQRLVWKEGYDHGGKWRGHWVLVN